jgi:hypothetical protein
VKKLPENDVKMPRKRAAMTLNERQELPSSLFLLSGTNPFRKAAVWLVRWIVFEWIIIITIIGKFIKITNKWYVNDGIIAAFLNKSSIALHWGFGSLFWNSLMHSLAERPQKIKINIFELLLI